MEHFDSIIIGSGGGTKLRPAASLGKRIAIIEKDVLGGTCLNRGCIPSKMLIYPSEVLAKAQHLAAHGIDVDMKFSVRWDDLVGRTSRVVDGDSAAIERGYANNPNITYFHGHGRFVDHKVIEIEGVQITAPSIYVATGSRPQIPSIPGLEGTPYWTSKDALRAEKQPRSILVIGGGYIAMELGVFYENLGTDVTYIARSGLLAAEDKDIRHHFEEYFSQHHKALLFTKTERVSYEQGLFHVQTRDANGKEETLTGEALLIATGVVPNSEDLGLEHTSIEKDERGYIKVDEYLETAESGVYALGDVIGRYLFRHSVNFEGEYLYDQHILKKEKTPISYPPMPHAVFTTPQIAGVGLTEDELIFQGKWEDEDYVTVTQEYKQSAMGMAMLPDIGFVKILMDKKTKTLLGAHIIGEKASDIIHMLILGMTMQAKIEDYLKMIYIHPALSEVVKGAFKKAKERV